MNDVQVHRLRSPISSISNRTYGRAQPDFDSRTRRSWLRDTLAVSRVHILEETHVGQLDGGFHQVRERATAGLNNEAKVVNLSVACVTPRHVQGPLLMLTFRPHAGETLGQVPQSDADYLRRLAATAQRVEVRAGDEISVTVAAGLDVVWQASGGSDAA